MEALYGDTERVHELAGIMRQYQEGERQHKDYGKEKGIQPDVHWNEKPDARDKAIRDEEKLYVGWGR